MRALIALLLSLWIAPAWAQLPMTGAGKGTPSSGAPMVSVIFADVQTAPSNSTTSQIAINGGVATTTLNSHDVPMPISGTIANLKVRFPTTLTQGSWVISLLKNNAAAGSPSQISCTIDTTHQTCADTTNSATFSPGDLLMWTMVPSGTPTAQTEAIQVSSTITGTTNGQGLILAARQPAVGSNPSNSAANYGAIGGGSIQWNATENVSSSIVSASGTIDGLYVKVNTAPGGATQSVFTVYKNGSATSLACTISGSATTCNDPIGGGHAVSVSPTDTISLQSCPGTFSGSCTPTGTPATAVVRASVGWIPATPGEQIIAASIGSLSNSGQRFSSPVGSSGLVTISATEGNALVIAPVALTLKNLYVSTDAALSGAQTRVNVNRTGTGGGQSNGSITCTLNSTNTTTCNDTSHSYSASIGDLLDWSSTPSGTPPATTYYKIGSVVTVP